MKRCLLGLAWLTATILTTQANACLEEPVDCGAVWTTIQNEAAAMDATCESSLSANEMTCAEATGAWNDSIVTWNDYCSGYRIVVRRSYQP